MRKGLALGLLMTLISLSSIAAVIERPSDLKWGAAFSHFSCAELSSEATLEPTIFLEGKIKILDLGVKNGGMDYGTLLAVYGENSECEYLVKFNRSKESESLAFAESSYTDLVTCAAGSIYLDNFFAHGLIYKQSGKGHANLSLEVNGSYDEECEGKIFIQFKRIR